MRSKRGPVTNQTRSVTYGGHVAAAEFAGECIVGHQDALGSVGQGFTNAVDAAMVRRDQTVAISETDSDCQARNACSSENGASTIPTGSAGDNCAAKKRSKPLSSIAPSRKRNA